MYKEKRRIYTTVVPPGFPKIYTDSMHAHNTCVQGYINVCIFMYKIVQRHCATIHFSLVQFPQRPSGQLMSTKVQMKFHEYK